MNSRWGISNNIIGLLLRGPIGRYQEYFSGVVGNTLKDSTHLPKVKRK
jgi:hypothetical protein